MCVLVPADGIEAYKAVKAVAEHEGPCYVRLGRADVPMVTTMDSPFTIGKATILREGTDVTLVGCGQMVSVCMDAAEELQKKRHIRRGDQHVHHQAPGRETRCCARSRRPAASSPRRSIRSNPASDAPWSPRCWRALSRPHEARMGTPDCFGESGESDDLMRRYGLTAEQIVASAEEVIRRKKS